MSDTNPERGIKVSLIVGYLALLGALAVAHRNPATGYELSLYRSTPPQVWGALVLAAAVGVVASLRGSGRVRDAGLLLNGSTALTVFALPLLRGYYFYGAGDSMSHVGWTRELAAGSLEAVNLLYPAIHVVTVAIGALGEVPLPLAMLYLVLLVFPVVFLVFVPLNVQLLAGTRRSLSVGLLAAMLFAPINNISIHPIAHPSSQAVLFLPFVLFVVLRYVSSTRTARLVAARGGSDDRRLTAFGPLLGLVSGAVVLIHPQQALNVVVLFCAIAGTQALYRAYRSGHPISSHRPLYAQTVLIGGLFLLWAPRFETVRGSFGATLTSVFGSASAGEVVSAKSQSLAAVGGDIVMLFVRLFLPGVVLSLLAGVLVVAVALYDLSDREADADGLLVYLTVALVPLFGVFLLLVASSTGDMYFRYQGFIMVPVTVLGAVTLSKLLSSSDATDFPLSRPTVSRLIAVLFVLLVPIAGVALHPSPYMYQPTSHVSESQYGGYAASFDHRLPDQEFAGVRGGPRRYVDAVYGTHRAETELDFPGYEERLPESVFNRGNYTAYYEDDRYVAVTAATYDREVRLYDGFRYSERGFERLDATPNVGRIRSSDGFGLYYVDAEEG
jgi:hypothetical protein